MADLSVLVVDDEAFLAEEVACGLELAGLSVLTTNSVTSARALLRERPEIGVVLSDIRMPREDGGCLALHARNERKETEALGVILMTGHGIGETYPGIVACVPKPFGMEQMITLVNQTLAEIAARRARAAAASV